MGSRYRRKKHLPLSYFAKAIPTKTPIKIKTLFMMMGVVWGFVPGLCAVVQYVNNNGKSW